MNRINFSHRPRKLLVGLAICLSISLEAQEFSAGINIDNPNGNAVLHLVSPNGNQGLLIPRLTTSQRNSMSLGIEDNGILVFDSEDGNFFFWNGSAWIQVSTLQPQNISEVLAIGNDAGSAAITNVSDPTNPQDVATKNYVDVQGFLTSEADGSITNEIQDLAEVLNEGADAGSVTINNVADPVNLQDVATKNYVDTQADSDDQDLDLAGTTLSLTNDASTVDLSGFLDNTDNQNLTNVLANGNSAGNNVIADVADPTNLQDVATKNYVDNQADSDDQAIDAFILSGTVLEISLEDDGVANETVDLASIDTDTDDQTLSLVGSDLSIADGNTVDLSSIEADPIWTTDKTTLGSTGTINDGGNLVDWTQLKNVPTDFSDGADNGITDLTGFDTDDLTEGTTNQYFTNARADSRIAAASVTDLTDVTSAGSGAIITAAERTQLASSISNISGFDTDDLTEGTTNQYFTDARVATYLGASNVTDFGDVTSAGSGSIITAAERTQLTNSISDISGFDTDDLTEGTTNLYFTNARADSRIAAASVTDLTDVTSVGSGSIITAAERTQLTNSISDISGFDTDDLTEGTTNQYFTNARVASYLGANSVTDFSDVTNAGSGAIITAAERTQLTNSISDISGFDTDDLTEGTTNQYFTNARVASYLGANSVTDFSDVTNAGSGSIITVAERTQLTNSISDISGFDTDDLTEGASNQYFTNARVASYLGANSVTDFSDVTNVGSGAIITAAERTQLTNSISDISGFDTDDLTEGTTNQYFTNARVAAYLGANNVTDFSDVTSAGSGAIITAAERTQLTNSISDISGFDTDDLMEGTTNQYFTNARADSRIAAASVTDLTDVANAGSGAIITAAERTQLTNSISDISGFDTDDLTEGTTNQYFTDARADSRIAAASVTDLTDVANAGSGAIITAAERTQLTNSISDISGFDTDDLTEGTTNQYFTNARVASYLGANNVTDFSDVTSAGSGAIITAAERTQLTNSISNISGFDTDDLTEGTTNQYFTNARVASYLGANSVTDFSDVTNAGSGSIITAAERTQLTNSISDISGFDTDDLTEGTTNQYFTNVRADGRIAAASVTDLTDVTSAGSGSIITAAERTQLTNSISDISGFDTDDLTEGTTNQYFTNARADGRIAAASVTDLTDVTSAGSGAIITAAERTQLSNSISDISGFDTDDLTEGTTNLYYTDSRADGRIAAASVTDLTDVTSAGSGAIITGAERTTVSNAVVSGDIGTSVQAQSARLDDVSGLAVTDGNFIVGDGTNFIIENGATARTSLGLGTSATIDVGTGANQIVQLNATSELPAVSATNLTDLDANDIVTTTAPSNGDILTYSGSTWDAVTPSIEYDEDVNGNNIGGTAGTSLSSGAANVLIGASTGNTISTGNANVIIGNGADGGNSINSSVIIGSSASGPGINSVVVGANAQILQPTGLMSFPNQLMALGFGSSVQGQYGVAIGPTASVGDVSTNSIAIGRSASIADNTTNAMALGRNASASASGAVAIGNGAAASTPNTVTLGNSAGTTYDLEVTGSIIVDGNVDLGSDDADEIRIRGTLQTNTLFQIEGNNADANESRFEIVEPSQDNLITFQNASGTVALDSDLDFEVDGNVNHISGGEGPNLAGGGGSANVVIGQAAGGTIDEGNSNIVIGTGADVSSGSGNDNNVVLGTNAGSSSLHAVAVGHNATAANTNAVAVGNGTGSTGVNSTSLGNQANATAIRALAIGSLSVADGSDAIAIGTAADNNGASSAIAIGNGASTAEDGAVALGLNSTVSSGNAVAIGDGANIGTLSDDAITILGSINAGAANSIAIGRGAYTELGNSIAIGLNSIHEGNDGVAIGTGQTSTGQSSVAIGLNSEAQFDYTVAMGDNAVAGASQAVAMGRNASASGQFSTAVGGVGATASNTSAIAVGNASASGVNSIAMGNTASTNALRGIAFGTGASATGTDAIAIGEGASASSSGAIAIGIDSDAQHSNIMTLGDPNMVGPRYGLQVTGALVSTSSAIHPTGVNYRTNSGLGFSHVLDISPTQSSSIEDDWFGVDNTSVLVDGTIFKVVNTSGSPVTFNSGGRVAIPGGAGSYVIPINGVITMIWIAAADQWFIED